MTFVARREATIKEHTGGLDRNLYEIVGADITKEEDRQRIVKRTIERFGAIDVLVNAAGIIGNGTIENTSLGAWDMMMDINLRALFRLTQIALPSIIER